MPVTAFRRRLRGLPDIIRRRQIAACRETNAKVEAVRRVARPNSAAALPTFKCAFAIRIASGPCSKSSVRGEGLLSFYTSVGIGSRSASHLPEFTARKRALKLGYSEIVNWYKSTGPSNCIESNRCPSSSSWLNHSDVLIQGRPGHAIFLGDIRDLRLWIAQQCLDLAYLLFAQTGSASTFTAAGTGSS